MLRDVVAKTRQAVADGLAGPVLDVILELVDLAMDPIDEVKEVLGNEVHDAIGEHPSRQSFSTHVMDGREIQRRALVWCLADRERQAGCQDEIDLLVVHAVLGRHDHGNEEHAEHVVAVTLESRAWLVLMDVRNYEIRGRHGRPA
jgi:hypothetical protein